LFGTSLFGGFRYDIDLDRDKRFNIPETKESYLQPDSSYQFTWRLGAPITKTANWNAELWASLYFSRASHPDIQDSVLISDDYKIEDRGLYQNVTQVPVGLSLVYDNLDLPYAPSRGSRVVLNGTYTFVGKYSGVRYDDLGISIEDGQDEVIKDGGKKHDFYTTEFIFQHYFLLGSSHQYVLSAKEARENRRFYTDFSWEEAVRVWRPENMRNTLFERRVIAMQYRLVSIWELEEGGAPHDAFINLNSKAPLRGYDDKWVTHNLMSFSVEYRWPVDRLVDGVIFDEYALIAPKIDKWSLDHYYNSWGFGIRVRQPDLYLFRLQFGFHGLHGVNLIMTIAPEFK
jgi:outer membrane protein assembly factor BamA